MVGGKTVRAFALAAAVALLLLGAAGAQAKKPSVAETEMRTAMQRLVRMPGGPPGVAVTVRGPSGVRFLTAGVADLRTGARWQPEDHMRIASVAKAFSGAVALSLAGEGRLKLSDSIQTLLPWLPAAWAPVTIADALQHTSGLPDYTSSPAFGEFFSANLHAYVSPRSLIEYVAAEPLDFAPTTEYHYSNTDNIVVALIAEAVTGQPYSQLLRERVFGPLRMPTSSLPVGFQLQGPRVRGYLVDPPKKPEDVTTLISMSGAWASGGIQSTPVQLNRFITGYVGQKLFGRQIQLQQFDFVPGHSDPPGPGENSAGLGIFQYRTSCGTVYGHTGNIFGYTQFAAATQDGRAVTVSANAQMVPAAKNKQVAKAFGVLRRIDGLAVCAAQR
jgi:D-alanyl-D-alanine carboxypeptidase